MHSKTDSPLVLATIRIWLALEVTLVLRDRVRGKGARTNDLGTRRLIAGASASSFALTGIVASALRHHSTLWVLGAHGDGPLVLGLVVMWLGLGLRVWAIAVLGEAFRTTVEMDVVQKLVESGPCCAVRHPSYSGALLIAVGDGVPSRRLASARYRDDRAFRRCPAANLVEERALINAMGAITVHINSERSDLSLVCGERNHPHNARRQPEFAPAASARPSATQTGEALSSNPPPRADRARPPTITTTQETVT